MLSGLKDAGAIYNDGGGGGWWEFNVDDSTVNGHPAATSSDIHADDTAEDTAEDTADDIVDGVMAKAGLVSAAVVAIAASMASYY